MLRRSALMLLLLLPLSAFGQRDLVPPSHPVYRYLLRQEVGGRIHGFQWGMLPLSRLEIAGYLDSLAALEASGNALSATDAGMLHDYRQEFSYDLNRTTNDYETLFPGFNVAGMFRDDRQKSVYIYTDSTTSLFLDGFGSYSYRATSGDSLGRNFASIGELGIRLRGTLFNSLGFYIQASNGRLFSGSTDYLVTTEPRLRASRKLQSDERAYFDFTTGYLRYDAGWISLMAGREQLMWGMGLLDRAVLSDNAVPFDFVKLDLKSNSVHYSFLHGSLVGRDTSGHTLSSKYIAAHRLEFNIGRRVRLGLNEAVIYSRTPISFTMLNPLIFLTSAELSTEIPNPMAGDDAHNSLLWIDAAVEPMRNVRFFGSLTIDDLKFSSLNASDVSRNTNKFGWQLGGFWNDAFAVPALTLTAEYSRINPFVGSHWTQVNSYTNWSLPLDEALQPNSDAWRFDASMEVTPRLSVDARLQLQRTGENIIDANGNTVYDAGSDILNGSGQLLHPNYFLRGRRTRRTLAAVTLSWQPVWQWWIELKGNYRRQSYPDEGHETIDRGLWMTVRTDI